MLEFNKKSRTKNATLSASMGIVYQITLFVMSFIFRTVFLMVLSKEYLGINGLFTNILSFLSIAELGIGSSIIYRMYKPIAHNDTDKVAALMGYYKKIYAIIALVVTVLGLIILPFLRFLIKDLSEVPSDVNIYIIYLLFLGQSVASYLFVYRSSIFMADQKGYIISFTQAVVIIVTNLAKIAVLFISKSFTLTLAIGIIIILIGNIIISIVATKKYPFVFNIKNKLDKETISEIKKDAFSMLCHRLGGNLVVSTDNILLSAFIGIGILGIYSNYSLIVISIAGLISQIFATFNSSIGNSKINLPLNEYFATYKRLLYLNLLVVGIASVALFSLLNPFIEVWLGKGMLFEAKLVAVLVASFFLSNMRQINIAYTSATGLFRKDKLRPLIEGIVNLIVSIILVIKLGIIGIFIGTVVSNFTVVFWRESYLIYKNEFKRRQFKYYIMVFYFIALTIGLSALMNYLFGLLPNNLGYLVVKFLLCAIISIVVFVVTTLWMSESKYYRIFVKKLICNFFNKIKNKNEKKMDDDGHMSENKIEIDLVVDAHKEKKEGESL